MPAIDFFYHISELAQYFNIEIQTRTRISPVTSVAGFFIFKRQRQWRDSALLHEATIDTWTSHR